MSDQHQAGAAVVYDEAQDVMIEQILEPAPMHLPAKPRVPAQSALARASDDSTGIGLLIEVALLHDRPIAELVDALKVAMDIKARRQYAEAMHRFRAEVTPVPKARWATIKGKDGKPDWGYSYAPLDVIDEHIKPICDRCGLSYRWNMKAPVNGIIQTDCIVRHVGGHEETTTFWAPIGESTFISKAQNFAAGNKFAMRQALTMALGLSTTDIFDDEELLQHANQEPPAKAIKTPQRREGAPPKPKPQASTEAMASPKQCEEIKKRADVVGIGHLELCRRAELEDLDHIPVAKVQRTLDYLAKLTK